ncbi:MAG: tRNA uracil 4-sulfurtransferase ThiI [Bacteriovoracaceae bacterium]
MANYKTLVLSVDELWLKGKNRKYYFKGFKNHVKAIIKRLHNDSTICRNESQKLVVESETAFSQELIEALSWLPGLQSLRPSIEIESTYEKIVEASMELVQRVEPVEKTFKVICKRKDKSFPVKSVEINQNLGHLIPEKFPHLKVDVIDPDLILEIKIYSGKTYISFETYQGIGGLPSGMTGHLLTLISGGFDSPIASYLMSKRGCSQDFIFFYAYPYVGEEVKDKILLMMEKLKRFHFKCRLYVIPFGDIQNKIAKSCHIEYRTLLFRKYMLECASRLAKDIKAQALVTGDNLGQVSSQTLENMTALDQATSLSIFRPLLGLNKKEIIKMARDIETHDISVIPHDDACSLFAPESPILRPDQGYLEQYFKKNDFTQDIAQAISDAEIYRFDSKRDYI